MRIVRRHFGKYGLSAALLAMTVILSRLGAEESTPWQQEDHGPFFTCSLAFAKPVKNDTEKGISIRLGADQRAAVCFDTDLLRMSAAWSGGFVKIPPGRDVATHPNPEGRVELGCLHLPGWSTSDDFTDPRPDHFGPMTPERGHYNGLYLHGEQVILSYSVNGTPILELFNLETANQQHAFSRTFEVDPSKQPLTAIICDLPGGKLTSKSGQSSIVLEDQRGLLAAAVVGDSHAVSLHVIGDGRIALTFPPHDGVVHGKVLIWTGGGEALDQFVAMTAASSPAPSLEPLTHGGPARWTPVLTTHGEVPTGSGAYVVDTLVAPEGNPWKSYLRFSGFDFFSNGDAAICSVSGDVWIVSGIDATLAQLKWKRFATGLFQPLGLKIVDDVVYVLGRDQITRLHDLDGDGEADFYENFNNGGKVTANGPDYCTSLEIDKEGNFYYAKCYNPTDQGGTILKVSKDGSRIEVFATGLRNSNGMAISPDGVLCVSDNEGEWVPASRIDFVKRGQFLGFTPMAHGPTPNHPGYPIWIPHAIDNSSGGQAWVPDNRWGPLNGALLHTSYGTASLYLVMPEIVNDRLQGATYCFPLKFASGIMRARFNPKDGQLYVCGLRGWQTTGLRSGAFHRVRFSGRPVYLPREIHNYRNGVRLSFTSALERKSAEDIESWGVSRWNYRWTSAYGSRDWSVLHPNQMGHDTVDVKSAHLSSDRKSIFLEIPDIAPVMTMEIQYNIQAEDGTTIQQQIYDTVHELGPTLMNAN